MPDNGSAFGRCLHGELNMVKTASSDREDTTGTCDVAHGDSNCPQPSRRLIQAPGADKEAASDQCGDPADRCKAFPGAGIFSSLEQFSVKAQRIRFEPGCSANESIDIERAGHRSSMGRSAMRQGFHGTSQPLFSLAAASLRVKGAARPSACQSREEKNNVYRYTTS
jgi:hypothetical protein